jgi:hypothetical protein
MHMRRASVLHVVQKVVYGDTHSMLCVSHMTVSTPAMAAALYTKGHALHTSMPW